MNTDSPVSGSLPNTQGFSTFEGTGSLPPGGAKVETETAKLRGHSVSQKKDDAVGSAGLPVLQKSQSPDSPDTRGSASIKGRASTIEAPAKGSIFKAQNQYLEKVVKDLAAARRGAISSGTKY